MNLQKFNFNFNNIYKELSGGIKQFEEVNGGTYHYLQNNDRFHDVLERSIKYFEDADSVEGSYFKSIFWKTWKFNRLASFEKTGKKTNESNNTTYELSENMLVTYQPDLDSVALLSKLDDLPYVRKVMEGYNVIEMSKELGISRHTYYHRYHKELKELR